MFHTKKTLHIDVECNLQCLLICYKRDIRHGAALARCGIERMQLCTVLTLLGIYYRKNIRCHHHHQYLGYGRSLTIHWYNTPNVMHFGVFWTFCQTTVFSKKLPRFFASYPCRVIQYLSNDVLNTNNFHVLMETMVFILDLKILYKMAAIFQDGG